MRQIRLNQVSESIVSGIMSWVIQLSYELNENERDMVFDSIYELGEELDRLLEIIITEYGS